MMENKEVKGAKREGKAVKPYPEREHCEQTQRKLNREVTFPEKCPDEVGASFVIKTRNLPSC
jgi:hypothetical protein